MVHQYTSQCVSMCCTYLCLDNQVGCPNSTHYHVGHLLSKIMVTHGWFSALLAAECRTCCNEGVLNMDNCWATAHCLKGINKHIFSERTNPFTSYISPWSNMFFLAYAWCVSDWKTSTCLKQRFRTQDNATNAALHIMRRSRRRHIFWFR